MREAVRIFEVSLRDGLQNERRFVPTEKKLRYLEQLVHSGLTDIEVTSFVRPDRIPALADADEIVQKLNTAAGVNFWALVPNQRGFERALRCDSLGISTVVSVSDTHNRRNLNRSTQDSLTAVCSLVTEANRLGRSTRTYLSTTFGCPYEGKPNEERVYEMVQELIDAGVGEVVLSDTIGVANPDQVSKVVRHIKGMGVSSSQIALHLHDTRGMAVANCYAGYGAGVRRFDGAVAGIGGCPYAPGATGNVATEDLVYLFHSLGEQTGVEIDELAQAGLEMAELLGRVLPGRYHSFWRSRHAQRRSER